ncbi:MAG: GNAT family N-acetyltransferase [Clostridiales bacterium]|nr:GNAT family N-acetyltransferase [Clostridiales bacterium]
MTKIYYSDPELTVRGMLPEDARILFDTYLSYGWHPDIGTYENYYRQQEAGSRLVFVPVYRGRVSGQCTLDLCPKGGPFAGMGYPEISDLTVFFDVHGRGIASRLLDAAEAEAAKRADRVYLAVGLHSGYGPAQRLYVKRGYVPDGSGAWYKGRQLEQYAPCANDDDLLLFLSKSLRADPAHR